MIDDVTKALLKKLFAAINAKNITAARNYLGAIKFCCSAAQAMGEGVTLKEAINDQDENGYTSLLLAAYKGLADLIPELIKMGVDIEMTHSQTKRNALYLAVAYQHPNVVQVLCKEGVAQKLNVRTQDGYLISPLMVAVWNGDEVSTRSLLELKSDVNEKDISERTPIFYAVNPCFLSKNMCLPQGPTTEQQLVVIKLLAEGGASVNVKCTKFWPGATPLMFAARAGRPAVVKALLELKADVNMRDNERLTALDQAVSSPVATENGQAEITSADRAAMVNLLLAAGPDQSAIDSAYAKALATNFENIIKAFTENSILPTAFIQQQRTNIEAEIQALLGKIFDAIGEGVGVEAFRVHIDHLKSACSRAQAMKVNITLQQAINGRESEYNNTPLIRAAHRGQTALVAALLDEGADVTCVNTYQRTALFVAVGQRRTTVVQQLCAADLAQKIVKETSQPTVNSQDISKYSPLMAAVWNGDAVATQCLLEQKANVNAKDITGRNALFYVANPWFIGKNICLSAGPTKEEQIAVIKQLSAAGIDASVRSKTHYHWGPGATALIYAARGGRPEIVEAIIALKANVNDRDVKGLSALEHAVESPASTANGQVAIKEEDRIAIVKVLLAAKPDRDAINAAFLKAVKQSYCKLVKLFIEHPIAPNLATLKEGLSLSQHKEITCLLEIQTQQRETRLRQEQQRVEEEKAKGAWDDKFARLEEEKEDVDLSLEDIGVRTLKKVISDSNVEIFTKLQSEKSFDTYTPKVLATLLHHALAEVKSSAGAAEKIAVMLIEKIQAKQTYEVFFIPVQGCIAIEAAVKSNNAAVVSALLNYLPHSQLYSTGSSPRLRGGEPSDQFRFTKEKTQKGSLISPILTAKEPEIDLLDCWWSIKSEEKFHKLFFTAFNFLEDACNTTLKPGEAINKEWQQAIEHLMLCRRIKPHIFNKLLSTNGSTAEEPPKESKEGTKEKEAIRLKLFQAKNAKLKADFVCLKQYFNSQPELLIKIKAVRENFAKQVNGVAATTPFWKPEEQTDAPLSLQSDGVTAVPSINTI